MEDRIYRPRIADQHLAEYIETFGAVVVEGPKWCGKTTTARQQTKSEFNIADPRGAYQNRQIALLNPDKALQGARPHLVDEWQEAPAIWDAVRFLCDQAMGEPGQFVLTGSATPRLEERPMHSGAGRIGRMRMDTMTLFELGASSGKVSLAALFAGECPQDAGLLEIPILAELVCRGGWPGSMNMTTDRALLVSRSYLDAVANEDMQRVAGARHDPEKVRRIIASLARNESTLATQKTIIADASMPDEALLNQETVGDYIKALKQMFFVADIPAWRPALRSPVRIRSAAKRHLADPSLVAAALNATPSSLTRDLKTLGLLFESLVLHDLLVYARAFDAQVMHYRDDSDLEVDAIVERRDGSWGAFEVKLGIDQVDRAAQNVLRLEKKMVERGEQPPAVKAVIVGTGGVSHRRNDGVCVVPIDTLAP